MGLSVQDRGFVNKEIRLFTLVQIKSSSHANANRIVTWNDRRVTRDDVWRRYPTAPNAVNHNYHSNFEFSPSPKAGLEAAFVNSIFFDI
jgi:hypothetical protein